MARIRYIKPDFFTDEIVVDLDLASRLLFIGLWTLADRDGRMECKPKQIKLRLFPMDKVDVAVKLHGLQDKGLIHIYAVDNKEYIQIKNFERHQRPHPKEASNNYPAPEFHGKQFNYTASQRLMGNGNGNGELEREHKGLRSQPDDFQPYLDQILDGVRAEMKLNILPDEAGWVRAAELSYENEFTPEHFVETLVLMRKQRWRTGAIKPETLTKNLPNLEKIKAEVMSQNGNGKPDPGKHDAAVVDAKPPEPCQYCGDAYCLKSHDDERRAA